MPYFDFHIHPTLKCMFSPAGAKKTDPWKDIDTSKINWIVKWCSEFSYILNSQTNMRQLLETGTNLVCITIFTPDPGLTNADLILTQAKGTLQDYLNPIRLKEINNDTLKPYPDLIHEDIFDVLLNPIRFGITDKKVVPLINRNDYDETNKDTLYVVFSVEGCHSLSSTIDKSKIDADDVLKNLDELREEKKLPIISINLTHLEQYRFCNHAYGILFVDGDFNPTGDRVSADGIKIMKHCYKNNILIDLKHTSLGARRMIIEDIRKRPDFTGINQPLVCTHAGFTGLGYNDIPDYMLEVTEESESTKIVWGKPKKYFYQDQIAFNPSSINLYDEDIFAILKSGGLIGLSLDKRILGFEGDTLPHNFDITYETEYISNKERGFFLTRAHGEKAIPEYCITIQEVLSGGIDNPNAAFYHLKHFMAHVGHLIAVANKFGYDVNKALHQVCIGSDFDGLINPVWCCDTISNMSNMEKKFIEYFPYFLKANKDINIPQVFDVNKFARRLFFENGRDFVLDRVEKLQIV